VSSPGAGVAGPSPVPVPVVAGVSPVPVQMWRGWAQSRCRCGRATLAVRLVAVHHSAAAFCSARRLYPCGCGKAGFAHRVQRDSRNTACNTQPLCAHRGRCRRTVASGFSCATRSSATSAKARRRSGACTARHACTVRAALAPSARGKAADADSCGRDSTAMTSKRLGARPDACCALC
jgi:hypothetical protein